MDTISAAVEADERVEPLAGALKAATHAIVAQNGEEHILTLVKVVHEFLLSSRTETGPIITNISVDVLPIAASSRTRRWKIGTDFQLDRVIGRTATSVPVITYLNINISQFNK